MRIAIISDVHANLAALESIQEPYDVLLCLGDLIDYGPQPREAVQWVKERSLCVVRGNHDHALAYDVRLPLRSGDAGSFRGYAPVALAALVAARQRILARSSGY